MGGSAFAQAHADGEPTLNTPRMSPETYTRLKSLCVDKLEAYFPNGRVVPLLEAPEKADYGDIDIFISIDEQVDFIHLASHLGAAGVICRDSKKATFGILADGTTSSRPPVVYVDLNDKAGKIKPSIPVTAEEYTQVDVAIISPDLLDWYTFYSSYSDLAGMIGHIVTNLGFTVSDVGFWVRLPELDFSKTVVYANIADRDGTIFLSSDPKEVISFLGCSAEHYENGFKTLEELYTWLGKCRFLSPQALEIKRTKSNVRRKERIRPIFSTFFREWLPAHMDMHTDENEEGRRETVLRLRKQYLQEAVDFFSKRVEYESKHRAAVLAIHNGFAANLVKPIIAEHSGMQDKHVTEILRAFRRRVVFDCGNLPKIAKEPHTDVDSELHKFLNSDQTALEDPEAVSKWVKMHWEELRALERQRGKPSAVALA